MKKILSKSLQTLGLMVALLLFSFQAEAQKAVNTNIAVSILQQLEKDKTIQLNNMSEGTVTYKEAGKELLYYQAVLSQFKDGNSTEVSLRHGMAEIEDYNDAVDAPAFIKDEFTIYVETKNFVETEASSN